ncbi:MAG: hypothetical protein DWI54_07535, partial [Chloroflexi bacterium]
MRRIFTVAVCNVLFVVLAAMLASQSMPAYAQSRVPVRTQAGMQITTGLSHSCAILTDGMVKCWGYNANGELGLGDTSSRGTDADDMGVNLAAIDLGTGSDGVKFTAKALSGGDSHTCAILSDDSLKCWGLNASGQLGIGNLLSKGDARNEMGNNLPKVNLGTGKTAKFVSAGVAHTCAILNDDTLKCWGANTSGQLGYGDTVALSAPSAAVVPFENGRTVRAVSAGIAHTCVILDGNSVHCWGNNADGQLGLENATALNAPSANPVNLGADLTATQISSRGDHSCAILNDGSVKCWGNNLKGQLGQNNANSLLANIGTAADQMGDNLPAITLGDGRTALSITTSNLATAGSSSFGNTCVILDDYTVKCWGANALFQLGRGTGPTTSSTGVAPGQMAALVPISLGTGLNAMQISLGAQHVCTVLGGYTIKCWGWGGRGQLGHGSFANYGSCCMGDVLPATNLNEPSAVAATKVSILLTTTATASKTPSPTRTASNTATPSRTRTYTKTRTTSPTKTHTKTPSSTRTASRTRTPSNTRTATPT